MSYGMLAMICLVVGYAWGKWSTKQFHDENAAAEAGYEQGYNDGHSEGYRRGASGHHGFYR